MQFINTSHFKVRKAKKDAQHKSIWHIRNLLRETGKELKDLSGAKSFASFLKEILKGKPDEDEEKENAIKFVSC